MKGTKLKMNVMIIAPANKYTGKSASHMEFVANMNTTTEKIARGIAANMAARVSLYLKSVLISGNLQAIHNRSNDLWTAEEVIMSYTLYCDKVGRSAGQ